MINRVPCQREFYEAECDRCGREDETKAADRDHARRCFFEHGWKGGNPKKNEDVICPDCVALEAATRRAS